MINSYNSLKYFESRFSQKINHKNFLLNGLSFLIMAMVFMLFIWWFGSIKQPITILDNHPVTLDYMNLFHYSGRTALRMFCAVIVSLTFTLIYGGLAAKNKYCEQILIPVLEILQSVPILGYISFTVTAFLAMAPGSIVGAELVAIFAIFTSQAWNMTFSFYQSLKSMPKELGEVAFTFNMNKWQRFWRLEVPYSIPPLIWNMVLSMSGGWLFVVASEVITVGDNHISLPGLGSYVALALTQKDTLAITYGIIAMASVILLYDQLLLRPLVCWSDKFRYEANINQIQPKSWALSIFYRSNIMKFLSLVLCIIARFILYSPVFNRPLNNQKSNAKHQRVDSKIFEYFWYGLICLLGFFSAYELFEYFHQFLTWSEVAYVFKLSSITLLRVVAMVVIASIIWVPIGIYIGLNPRYTAIAQPIIQLMASFPINLLFPVAVVLITHYKLNPEIWLSLLMIAGTQWYILFNVIAGVSLYPNDLKEVTKSFNIKGWLLWRRVMLPAISPWFLIGAITAFGGAWNISILAEVVTYGSTKIEVNGVGSYIADYTIRADFPRIMLGTIMMSLFVVVINRLFWKPLLRFIDDKYNLYQ